MGATAAKWTYVAGKAYIDANIWTNGAQSITGAILNQALTNILFSMMIGEYKKANKFSVTTAGTTVTFATAFTAATEYSLAVRCYDNSGNNIDFVITDIGVASFKITPAVNARIDYIAMETGTGGGSGT